MGQYLFKENDKIEFRTLIMAFENQNVELISKLINKVDITKYYDGLTILHYVILFSINYIDINTRNKLYELIYPLIPKLREKVIKRDGELMVKNRYGSEIYDIEFYGYSFDEKKDSYFKYSCLNSDTIFKGKIRNSTPIMLIHILMACFKNSNINFVLLEKMVESNNENLLEQKNELEINKKSCPICWVNELTILIEPCNHVCACKDCIKTIKVCPICRGNISNYKGIFIC